VSCLHRTFWSVPVSFQRWSELHLIGTSSAKANIFPLTEHPPDQVFVSVHRFSVVEWTLWLKR